MCERGHAAKMVLSHHAACFNHWLPERPLPMILPRWLYLHIHNDVVPALKRKGVTEEHLNEMLVENPRKIFERQVAY
jgi:phosphotriesterase-related protein